MDKQKNIGTRPGDAEGSQESGVAAPGPDSRLLRQRKVA
jgi:hypothetical protein